MKWIQDCWSIPMTTFISKVFREPKRPSGGRQRLEHEQTFDGNLAQYESGDVMHLDDLNYNPIINLKVI
ncbi:hypothetical protein [Oceanobacillus caeni]|uniref:hypothetical protein n=1 Tax=Oceanobacillus caeni TaxID=405946 RepID=UPI0011B42F03